MTETRKLEREFSFDRHSEEFRLNFESLAGDMHAKCPVAWNAEHEGHWVAASHQAVFDIARNADVLSNDNDVNNERRGYVGVAIPPTTTREARGGFLEMDPPEQRYYRQALNPYLSPAAVERWKPFVAEVTRAALDERIESGSLDFVDDLANIVPAVLTMAMMGLPLTDWVVYNEPAHATVYTKPDDPSMPQLLEKLQTMGLNLFQAIHDIRSNPRPGMVDALVRLEINGEVPSDVELTGVLALLIGGGFDTTTALTAHSLAWLSANPGERERLSRERDTLLDPATEEFLRYFTPAPGDGRTFSQDCEISGVEFKEGERLYVSWAMANRDATLFENPNEVVLDRARNRHTSFGLGIHRCIGSNMARMTFKQMLTAILDRMPDYQVDRERAVYYDTVGIINGMKHLPASFAPGKRLGAGLEETLAKLQVLCDEQGLAAPVTERRRPAAT